MVKKWGMRLLGLWLVVQGLAVAIELSFANSEIVLGVLGIIVGVLVFFDR